MLMPPEQVAALLRCPRTGRALKSAGAGLCVEGETGVRYHRIHDLPVLIDFERSILDEATVLAKGAAPPVRRRRKSNLGGWARRLTATPAINTVRHVRDMMARLKTSNEAPRVLVVGGGTIGNGMQMLYDDPTVSVVAFDIYASDCTQFIADAHVIPLPDESFDAVVIQAVLEHVLDPPRVVAEIHRLLRPEGLLYAETPFMQQVHEGAYDFTRYTESGHRYLFRRFALVDAGVVAGPGTQLLWSIDYFFRGLFRSRAVGKGFKILFFWLRWFDGAIPAEYAVDAASCVYFLGCRREESMPARAIVDYYRGVSD